MNTERHGSHSAWRIPATRLAMPVVFLFVSSFPSRVVAQPVVQSDCRTFESFVGHGKVNIVDFRRTHDPADSPFIFRLLYSSFRELSPDGFFGPITTGEMTFSYPRRNNPEMPYNPHGSLAERFTQGPAYGDIVEYQARQIACNVFEVHWKEPKRGDTVTHIEDFDHEQVCTNIAGINRAPIPEGFDPLNTMKELDNTELFPTGNPVMNNGFQFISLCGRMTQSLASARVWEDQLHYLVLPPSELKAKQIKPPATPD